MTTPLIGSTTTFYDAIQVLNSFPPPTLDFSSHILQQHPTPQLHHEGSYEYYRLIPSVNERFAKLPQILSQGWYQLQEPFAKEEVRLSQEPLEPLFEDYEMDDQFPIQSIETYCLPNNGSSTLSPNVMDDQLPSLKEIELHWLNNIH